MRIGNALIALIMIVAIMVMTIVIPAIIGAVVGTLASFVLGAEILPVALIGALSDACSGLAFLLNAKTNGNKGL